MLYGYLTPLDFAKKACCHQTEMRESMLNLNRQFGAGRTGNAAGRHKDEHKIADLELGYLS